MLYKTGMVTKTETISDKIIVYYVYVFLNKNTVAKGFTVQSLRVVCIWENDKIILDSGFKKDCNVNNEWLYWENKSCPSMKELEHELKKAFNFEQIEKKGKEKRKEGQMTLFFNKKKPTLIQIGF
jgi:predicted ATPase